MNATRTEHDPPRRRAARAAQQLRLLAARDGCRRPGRHRADRLVRPDGPAIVPVNFTVADGFLWFQTRPDSRLAHECGDQQVLVEVDQVDPATHTGWSVVVTGVARCLSTRGSVPASGSRMVASPY